MTSPAIRFVNVSKRYTLRRPTTSFREWFVNWRQPRKQPPTPPELWALRDVSFEIIPGETVGLIGANGAGKSTALKLIGQIIPPSTGEVRIQGRVAALLELGTGFHPELTGRENVFLSAALTGMGRVEIASKFEAIVEFAELSDFIDQPVKYYSSGMFARLAFAVSIHLSPEILLVDEVLAVGDQAFQQKCVERIAALQQAGVTICYVSHSLESVRRICHRAIWFDHGRIRVDDNSERVAQQYAEYVMASGQHALAKSVGLNVERWGNRKIEIEGVRFLDAQRAERTVFEHGQPFIIEVTYQAHEKIEDPVFGFALHRQDGLHITGPNTSFAGHRLPPVEGRGVLHYEVEQLPLLEGLYQLSVSAHNRNDTEMYDFQKRRYTFQVMNARALPREIFGLMSLGGNWHWNA